MFKELPLLKCVDNYTKEMNYLVLALTTYKAPAEVIFGKLINVTIICQVIRPMLTLQSYKNLGGVIKQFLLCLEVQQYANDRGIS